MVKVYAESNSHAELIAVFPDEATYEACSNALEKLAAESRMIITESVLEDDENISVWNSL